MQKDKGTSVKQTQKAKEFLENTRCTRRSKNNGVSVDKEKLTMAETQDLIVSYFEENNERYKELIKMEYIKNV